MKKLVTSSLCLLSLLALTLLLGGGILVLLVLRDEIVHVGLSLSELHLVHALAGVPVEESLAPEHGSELLRDTLEHLLDSGRVSNEGGSHLKALGGDVANGGLDVVGDPLDEVRGVLVLDIKHLLIDLLGGHAATEEERGSEVASVAGVSSAHHVLGIPNLLGDLGNGEGTVLLGSTAGEGGKADHEEVEAREGDQVDSKLAEISIELTREAEAASDTRHDGRDKMVEVSEGRGGELEGPEADVIEGLIVKDEGLIRVLDELMDREGGIVGLDDGIRDLGGGDNGEGAHHAVGVLLADLRDEKGSHSGSSASSEGVGDLESLETVTRLSLLADNVKDGVNELSTLSVVSLGPVVSGSSLAEDKVIRAEELAVGSSADRVHGTGLKIHEDSTGNIASSGSLVEVDVDALKLEVRVASISSSGVNAVLVRDNLPELGSDLVAALASLHMDDFTHGCSCFG